MKQNQAANHTTPKRNAPQAKAPRLHAKRPSKPPLSYSDPIVPIKEETGAPKVKRRHGIASLKGFLSFAQLIGGAIILAVFINHFVFQSYQVYGQSMAPTLQEGDRLIISKVGKSWSSLFGKEYVPKRGEIIVFHNPQNPDTQLVKRVVGLPGDRVVVHAGKITVYTPSNPKGFDFDEIFNLKFHYTVGSVDIKVPEGEIFVVGDNRMPGGSLDSRNDLGTVPLSTVVGNLIFRIFPVTDAKLF